jgi:hypothetical protein
VSAAQAFTGFLLAGLLGQAAPAPACASSAPLSPTAPATAGFLGDVQDPGGTPAGGGASEAPASEGEAVGRAQVLLTSHSPDKAVEVLKAWLKQSAGGPTVHDLLGQALVKLGRKDEAAHHFDIALALVGDAEAQQRPLRDSLTRADPLFTRRSAFFKKVTKSMLEVGTQLFDSGHAARAQEILAPLKPIATGADLAAVKDLLEKIRSASAEVNLEEGASEESAGENALVMISGRHYEVEANLEREVAQRVADVMDDIFAYYVLIYFDGDEKRVLSTKPKLRIHPTMAKMLENWQGGGDSKPAGWWSPGTWEVVTYDTRDDTGGLDWMLEILFHESSHHFMTMLEKGGWAPSWLNEGTASFFEGTTAMADHRVLWPDAPPKRLDTLNYQLTHGMGPSVEQVIGYNKPSSYPGEYYSFGWGLVYFLQQYEDPQTLEYVYRPLYSQYRETITSKGGDSKELFEQVFLGPKSPGKFATLKDFTERWRKWICEEVYPLHSGRDVRRLRIDRSERYIAAANAVLETKKLGKTTECKIPEKELLERALGDLEYVRTKVDSADEPSVDLILQQANVLERLGRPAATAPLLEQVLDFVDTGKYELAPKDYDALEKRLQQLDRKNAALRTARNRAKSLAKSAVKLLADYEACETPMTLRSYTFAQLMAAACGQDSELLAASARLRAKAQQEGVLSGALVSVLGKSSDWKTIFVGYPETLFEVTPGRVAVEGIRFAGRICSAIPVSGEYELRFRLGLEGENRSSTTFNGVVFSGSPTSDWLSIGINGRGKVTVKRQILSGGGGGPTEHNLKTFDVVPPLAEGERPECIVHVYRNNRVSMQVGVRAPLEYTLDQPLPSSGFCGVIAKSGRTVLENLVIESFP